MAAFQQEMEVIFKPCQTHADIPLIISQLGAVHKNQGQKL
jgi:hypothetical protein